MTSFYSDQLEKLKNESLPLPSVKFKDSNGYSSSWMHLTPECISAVQKYLIDFTPPLTTDQLKPTE